MTEDFLCDRLRALRNERGISARELSLSIGQNETYINKIETKKGSPSMESFFKICEFFNITPSQFFNQEQKNHIASDDDILEIFRALSPENAKHFLSLMKAMGEK